MVLELVAGGLMLAIFLTVGQATSCWWRAKGLFLNSFEVILVFIRDEVARPAIGQHDADRYLPYLWNVFFFILFCNLLGVVPGGGSPTGALTVRQQWHV